MQVGKSALVTGASRGIGRSIALELGRQGYAVVVNYTSQGSEQSAKQVAQEIEQMGGAALAVQADVSDFEKAGELVRAAEALAPLAILINNAGITRDGLIMRMSEQDFDAVLSVNLKGAFNCMRHASALMMRRRQGRIINISSVVGAVGNAGQANYAASKAGLIGLSKSAARELAGRGVTVNTICPGFIRSDMTDQMPEAAREQMLRTIPMGRPGEAEEIAAMAAFLCSDGAAYITGHEFFVDGGMCM